jgi:CRISPR/Cas system CSM-associated protein Csm3 (group 7 of RAMP superfamily)
MSQLYFVRLVLEAKSPMAISTGLREKGFDTQLARDANGLPYIPSTSLAGVWRNLARASADENNVDNWFGASNADSGKASAISISNAHVLDSESKALPPLALKSELEKDPVLKHLLLEKPMHRERVALNDRGVAIDQAKFDQIVLPTGVRFSVDICWNTQRHPANENEWHALLTLWLSPFFAVGSNTRNGLGRLAVVAAKHTMIDLSQGEQAGKSLTDFRKPDDQPNTLCKPFDQQANVQYFAEIPLQALDTWRCGTASSQLGKLSTANDRLPDSFSYSEQRITWQNGKSAGLDPKPMAILCGSSIKGILAHRIAYHWRRLNQQWADNLHSASEADWVTRPSALSELLGLADKKEHGNSKAGRMYVEDVELEYKHTLVRTHNNIDRFTGGVRKGALFSEELIYQPRFSLKLAVAPNTCISPSLKAALEATLADLQNGLLPMGAGSGRGNSLVMADANKPFQINWSQLTIDESLELDNTHENSELTQGADA